MTQRHEESVPATRYGWQRQTIGETYRRICRAPSFPWLAIGDFLDDWRRSAPEDRLALVEDGITAVEAELGLRR